MARRRMFSLDVVDTDHFLDMPTSTQALYYSLGMRADDDGFVASPRRVSNLVGCSNDDLRLLITKGYLIPFQSGVVVITDWCVNNNIQKDRYRPTRYTEELSDLTKVGGRYTQATSCIQDVSNMYTQVRLGKDSIDKDSIEDACPEPENQAQDRSGILLSLVDGSVYDVPISKIAMWENAYPAVDIRHQLGRMAAWLTCNPKKRKTRRGIDRFINNWLSKAQDRGGGYRTGQQMPIEEPEEPREYRDDVERYAQYLGDLPGPDDPFQ